MHALTKNPIKPSSSSGYTCLGLHLMVFIFILRVSKGYLLPLFSDWVLLLGDTEAFGSPL